ncbi:hypothetical protein [Pigmentiphaga sp.]|uniref:hypothetical protein n=1 Tax=Pigmentiphaga sp. TaxID=1977564 RepID=UPI0025EFAD8A|nr:hypothetical protein [Pigmentiphaga sp.]
MSNRRLKGITRFRRARSGCLGLGIALGLPDHARPLLEQPFEAFLILAAFAEHRAQLGHEPGRVTGWLRCGVFLGQVRDQARGVDGFRRADLEALLAQKQDQAVNAPPAGPGQGDAGGHTAHRTTFRPAEGLSTRGLRVRPVRSSGCRWFMPVRRES